MLSIKTLFSERLISWCLYNEFHNLTDPKLFTEDNKQKIWKLISIKEEIPLMFPSLNNMS